MKIKDTRYLWTGKKKRMIATQQLQRFKARYLVLLIQLLLENIEIEYKIPNISNLAVKAALNTKAAEIKNKKPDTSQSANKKEQNRLTKLSFDARIKEP